MSRIFFNWRDDFAPWVFFICFLHKNYINWKLLLFFRALEVACADEVFENHTAFWSTVIELMAHKNTHKKNLMEIWSVNWWWKYKIMIFNLATMHTREKGGKIIITIFNMPHKSLSLDILWLFYAMHCTGFELSRISLCNAIFSLNESNNCWIFCLSSHFTFLLI